MTSYRIYVVGPDGRLRLGEAFEARNDEEAHVRLAAHAGLGEAELWAGGRLIARRSKAGDVRAGP